MGMDMHRRQYENGRARSIVLEYGKTSTLMSARVVYIICWALRNKRRHSTSSPQSNAAGATDHGDDGVAG